MSNKQSETDELIARIDADYREELESVLKGETTPRDDFEKHLAEATKIRNNVVNHECESPSLALKDAMEHLEAAREKMPNSNQRDVLGDIVSAMESEINQMMKLEAYDKIMTTLLQAYEAHPEMDVEQIITQVAQELGLSEKSMESINASMGMLDKMQEKKESLETAHENCDSTKKWILSETAKMTDSRTDNEKAEIVKAITKAVDRSVEESLKSEETNKEED